MLLPGSINEFIPVMYAGCLEIRRPACTEGCSGTAQGCSTAVTLAEIPLIKKW